MGVDGHLHPGGKYWGLEARRCDSCKTSAALLYCRADAAYLCGTCDARVHGANRLASRHERVWLCEVCEQSPATVTCKADAAALCASCDADIHSANPLSRRHERLPIMPFLELPSAAGASPGAAASVLFSREEDNDNAGEENEEEAASWLLPNPGSNPNPIGINLNLEGGGEVVKSGDVYLFCDVDPFLDLERFQRMDSVVPVRTPAAFQSPAAAAGVVLDFGGGAKVERKAEYSSFTANSLSQSMSSSEAGVVPDVTKPAYVSTKADVALDREARLMRYREKRKNRRFQKTIRYASRKAYAETRPRIKGRFAKRTETDTEEAADRLFGFPAATAAGFMMDTGYGVVPSF